MTSQSQKRFGCITSVANVQHRAAYICCDWTGCKAHQVIIQIASHLQCRISCSHLFVTTLSSQQYQRNGSEPIYKTQRMSLGHSTLNQPMWRDINTDWYSNNNPSVYYHLLLVIWVHQIDLDKIANSEHQYSMPNPLNLCWGWCGGTGGVCFSCRQKAGVVSAHVWDSIAELWFVCEKELRQHLQLQPCKATINTARMHKHLRPTSDMHRQKANMNHA